MAKKPRNPVARILWENGTYRKRITATSKEKATKKDNWSRKAKFKGKGLKDDLFPFFFGGSLFGIKKGPEKNSDPLNSL
jgi:hypothetical protein